MPDFFSSLFSSFDLESILYSIVGVVIGFTVHEYGHAVAADMQGDDIPRMQGRLSLSPLKHMSLMGTVFMIFFGFGWAKPVETNPLRYKDFKKGRVLVPLAGPMANLLTAVAVFIVELIALVAVKYFSITVNDAFLVVILILDHVCFINIVLCILNLLPVPGFDGYHILKTLLFDKAMNKFIFFIERYSMVIFIVLGMFGVFDYVVYQPSIYLSSLMQQLSNIVISLV